MKILLDTCTFLWLIKGSKELSPKAVEVFEDPKNEVYLSSVSAWEINVKYSLGRLSLPVSPDKLIPKERKRHLIPLLPNTQFVLSGSIYTQYDHEPPVSKRL